MATDTRTRMLVGAALLIGTHGARSTSLRELAREADVPIGSTYHHFPGGKDQLVDEAVRATGRHVTHLMELSRDEGADAGFEAIITWIANTVRDSDFRSGCPVLAVATEDDEQHRATAKAVFEDWQRVLSEVLAAGGIPVARASRLSRLCIAAIEGATAVCRAEQSLEPLEEVGAEIRSLLARERTAP